MPIVLEQCDPVDLRLPEFLDTVYVLENIDDHILATVYSQPIVKGCLSPRSSKSKVLFETKLD